MTPFDAIDRFARTRSPDVQRAILKAWANVRALLPPETVARMLLEEGPDAVVRVLLTDEAMRRAFLGLEGELRATIEASAVWQARRLPPAIRAAFGGEVAAVFNVLNPRVIDAVRTVTTKHVASPIADARELVRAFTENALRDGVSPLRVAREVRQLVGLGPTQWQEVANFRAALEAGDAAKALGYVRRDRRFDAQVRKGDLTPAQIDKMVAAYTKRRVALNAETAARTATLDSLKRGQRLAWEESIALGAVDRTALRRRWLTTLDGRERPEHHALNGTVVGFDEAFPNGEQEPGESTYNCRCTALVFSLTGPGRARVAA